MIQNVLERTRGILALFLLAGSIAYAAEAVAPGRELLEFIAEFDDVDNDTFELMLFFGQRDAGGTKHDKTGVKMNTEETHDENY